MTAIEDAARAYVAARAGEDGADKASWLYWACQVDGTWHALRALIDGCDCGCEYARDEQPRPIQNTLPL